MARRAQHVALVLSLNKRFDRKVIEGVTRFVHESGSWSVFLEDDPTAKIPDFRRGHFDGVIADLDDPRIPRQVAGLTMPVVGIGGIESNCSLNLTVSTVGTHNRKIVELEADYLMRLAYTVSGTAVPATTIDPWTANAKTFAQREAQGTFALFSARYAVAQLGAVAGGDQGLARPAAQAGRRVGRERHAGASCAGGVPPLRLQRAR